MTGRVPRPIHEILAEYREKQAMFERRCWERWKPAFDLYDWVLLQTQNAAIFFLRYHRSEAVEQRDALYAGSKHALIARPVRCCAATEWQS
jgi:hypothetical protein